MTTSGTTDTTNTVINNESFQVCYNSLKLKKVIELCYSSFCINRNRNDSLLKLNVCALVNNKKFAFRNDKLELMT